MTQRIFDVDNPQDIQDLFELLPNRIQKSRWMADDSVVFLDKDGTIINSNSLFRIAWRDKTEITRPADKSKWIDCLCWFTDDAGDDHIGVLQAIHNGDDSYPYICKNKLFRAFKACRPVRRDEVKFADDAESKE